MKKLLEKYGKKKVYIALGSLAAVIVVVGVAIGMSLNGNDKKLELKKDTFVVEYGEEVSTEAKAYIKTDDKEVAKNAKVVIDLEKEKGGNNYVAVGKYKGQVSYEDEKVEFTLKVEDTVKPKFENFPDTLEIQQGCKDDLSTRFKATDLSGVKITVDTSKVDLNTLGEYEMKVTVEDGHGNKTTKTCKVVVKEKEETPEKPSNGNAGNGSTNAPAWQGGNSNNGNASNGNVGGNVGNNNNGNSGGSSNGGNNNGSSQTPYIVEDGRTLGLPLSMQSPLFNTEGDAIDWANKMWSENINYPDGYSVCLVRFSDGSFKYSIYWYNPN